MAMTSSTDTPGLLTKNVEDSAIALEIFAGKDEKDASTVDLPVPNYSKKLGGGIKELKIGLIKDCFMDGLNKEVSSVVLKAVEKLKELGASVEEISLPSSVKYGISTYYIITPSEVSSNLARFDGVRYGFSASEAKTFEEVYTKSRGQGFGAEAKRRIMLGTYALSAGYRDAYYIKAQKVRTIIKKEFDDMLEKFDCLITPTQPTIAFKIGKNDNDPLAMYLEDIFAAGPSLSGIPAFSVPCGFSHNMPIGIQFIGKRFNEEKLFKIAHTYEQATPHHKEKPNL